MIGSEESAGAVPAPHTSTAQYNAGPLVYRRATSEHSSPRAGPSAEMNPNSTTLIGLPLSGPSSPCSEVSMITIRLLILATFGGVAVGFFGGARLRVAAIILNTVAFLH